MKNQPRAIKGWIMAFLAALTLGYSAGMAYLATSGQISPKGIEENYKGNEDNEAAEVMKFEKSQREVLGIIHTHAITLSIVFLILGIFIFMTDFSGSLKRFLMIEPLVSIVITFGGIWLLWQGWAWMKTIVMISGVLMHGSFYVMIILLFYQLLKR